MKNTGIFNLSTSLQDQGLDKASHIYYNLQPAPLYEESLARRETKLTAYGALAAYTGHHTGRSPKDKFIVRNPETETSVWWDNNQSISQENFDLLYHDFIQHTAHKDLFVQDLIAGSDPAHAIRVRVITEYAWHSLFIHNLLITLSEEDLQTFIPELTILDFPSFQASPKRHGSRSETIIACDFSHKIILIGGTSYAGEIKKAVFTFLNYILPPQDILPMHCSVNEGEDGHSAVFFGLSGTGKTTLSADPKRLLIGDDEHGWGSLGVFNFEGGCYAKTIHLSALHEAEIYAATQSFGTVLENVILDKAAKPDFNDNSLTENCRCAYPLSFIPNAKSDGRSNHPKNIIMLTADAFGVLPPIAKLTPAQAMYQFLSGYTAKLAGTEKGVLEPEATFSTCFGAPFMPRHPLEYGQLLRELIAKHGVDCWLVNTGWTGGPYGIGQRIPLPVTRSLIHAILDGILKTVKFRKDEIFSFYVPESIPNLDSRLLDPRSTWQDLEAFDRQAHNLAAMFVKNFAKFSAYIDDEILNIAKNPSNKT